MSYLKYLSLLALLSACRTIKTYSYKDLAHEGWKEQPVPSVIHTHVPVEDCPTTWYYTKCR